jgi:hypothetical protein
MNMNRKYSVIFATSAVLAGGLVAVVLAWPDSVCVAQKAVSGQVRARTRWAGNRLADVQDQLSRIETQIQNTSSEFAQRIAEAGRSAAEQYLPDDPLRRENWDLDRSDITHDLPRIPRG